MHASQLHYFPMRWPFELGLLVFFALAVALIEFGILRYTFSKIGIEARYVIGLMFLSWLGSYVNIPIMELPPEQVYSNQIIEFQGVQYMVPAVEDWPRTVIAVNLGGAVIPILLSIYLLIENQLFIRAIAGVAFVAIVVHQVAQPVAGVGIAVPTWLPPIVAAVTAMVLCWRKAAPLAYVIGSLGTLVGADIMNLENIRGLHAPIASIGGAGTFDGIFVSGILAVLLIPSIGSPPPPAVEPVLPAGAPELPNPIPELPRGPAAGYRSDEYQTPPELR
ncbi:MAG TPA: DUF1614 domain-containing protein [Pirellulales bacterium]|jgi:uncharacterized membrane protein|nr:DUF1614 domain-containing protein [Pirellulales bacterium]